MAAAAVFAQLIVVLSVLPTIEGSSDVFRVVGDSVQLEINGSVSEFDEFFWTFSESVNVLKYYKKHKDVTHSPRYKDRVKFNEETCSLTLKNLQKTDSGPYEVKASNADRTTTATYRLSVLDPVEPPVLTVYNTTDPCNITLTCRGHDLSIISTCYKKTCEEKEVTSPGGVALSLSVRNSIIICNHSNPVSWKQENKTFTELCAHTEPPEVHSGSYLAGILITVGILVLLVILVLPVVVYLWIKQRGSADAGQCGKNSYTEGEFNDHPSSRKARLELDSTEYSTLSQHPASNGASRH